MTRLSPEDFHLAARLMKEAEAKKKHEWFETCWRLVNHYSYRAFGYMMYKWDLEAGKRLITIMDKLERRAAELGVLLATLREKGCIDDRAEEETLRAIKSILMDARAGRRTSGDKMAELSIPAKSFVKRAHPMIRREEITSDLLSKERNYVGIMLVLARFLREESGKYGD